MNRTASKGTRDREIAARFAARLPSLPTIVAGQAILAASPWFTWTSVLACR
jgi:hypothetical protein